MTTKKFYYSLLLHTDLSNKAFSSYLDKKLYLHALCIRKNNKAIYKLLLKNCHKFSAEVHPQVVTLLNHYDIWLQQFSDFKKTKSFTLDEPFVFYHLDKQSAYPKEALPVILEYLKNKSED
jgi:hypothetical protein